MGICICDISALELYRASGRLLPDLLGRPRTSKLDGFSLTLADAIEDDLTRLGVESRPYHLLIGSEGSRWRPDGIVCHRRLVRLPLRTIVLLDGNTAVVSPEFLFLELCGDKKRDEVDLALMGFEFCGTYVLDASWDGFTNTESSLTSLSKLRRIVDTMPQSHGIVQARRILAYLLDASHSPMESILAMIFVAPRRLGGLGISGAKMNYRISTPVGMKFIDLAFPALGIGLEYKGRKWHSPQVSERDDRRQNKIVGSGVTILNVWYEDLAQPHLFEQLIEDFKRASGLRLRIRDDKFEARQRLLLAKLMPAVKRCLESIG